MRLGYRGTVCGRFRKQLHHACPFDGCGSSRRVLRADPVYICIAIDTKLDNRLHFERG